MTLKKKPGVAKEPRPLRAHVLICTNQRPPGHPRGSCAAKGSEALVKTFKIEIAKRGLGSEIRAQKAGCLDTCEYGISVVVYPDNIWYGEVTDQDASEIVEAHLCSGNPVDRLKIPGK